MKKQSSTMRVFQCPKCETKVTAPKRSSHRTKVGHIKTMWCWKCKHTRQFEQTE